MIDFDAIRRNNPLPEIAAQYIPDLKRHGNEWKGCCPFHNENTPSFTIYSHDTKYQCFGCSTGGDVIDFVAAIEGIDGVDAAKKLEGRVLPVMTQQKKAASDEFRKKRQQESEAAYEEGTAQALKRWERAKPATEANAYLAKKGIEPHTARIEGANLLVAINDKDGNLQSVQSISPDGKEKRFQSGAPIKGGRLNFGICIDRTIICEGFATGASIYESIPERVCVAYSIGGVKDIAREYSAAGMNVAIAADRKGYADILALGQELDIPVFIPPAPYDDFNDLAVGLGHEEVKKILRSAPLVESVPEKKPEKTVNKAENENDEPVDVWARNPVPALPEGLLPPIIERFSMIRSRLIGGDPGGLAMSGLAVCGAAISDRIKVKVKRNESWAESARLWVMLIGDPSYKKSPIMRAAAGKISAMDSEMLREHDKALAEWQRDKKDGVEGEQPQEKRLRIEDTTMEAAQEVCKSSPDGILALQDELSGWFGGLEKYSGGKGGAKDRAFWLRSFSGGEYAVNRISRKSVLIDNLSISILGGIQPDAIRRVMQDSTDDGLIQRFLPVVLAPADVGVDEEMPDVAREYDDLVQKLNTLKPPQSIVGDRHLVFDDGAMEIRADLERQHHKMTTSIEHVNKKLASHLGKYDGIFPRLCVIWHCIENVNASELPDVITTETARRVSEFFHGYVMKHALSFYTSTIGISDDQDVIEDIAGYILAHEVETVTMRTFDRGSTRMRKMTRHSIDPICQQLEALGWLDKIDIKGEKFTCKVNPQVHAIFKEKAEAERRRRQEMVSTIQSMVGKSEGEAA